MPPRGRPPKFVLPDRTLVIDNGAYTIKAGFASESPNTETDCQVIPNTIAKTAARTWVGPQLEGCTDFAEMIFRRPVQKGYLVNWEAEREIWDLSFFDSNAKLHVSTRGLLLCRY
jgi:actin-related protein 6